MPIETEEEKFKNKDKVAPLTLEKQKKFIAVIKGPKLEMLFIFTLSIDLRQGELLGHTDIYITANTYTHVLKEHKEKSVDIFSIINVINDENNKKISTISMSETVDITVFMVHPTGFEPATDGFEVQRSIQLSYGCINKIYTEK